MDERIDIVDNQGNATGKTCYKSEAHRFGYFHITVHIWLYTLENKILLQKRALTKLVFPGLWDISVAGHIGAGEEIKTAALREIKEEIGLDLQLEDLSKITVRKHQVHHDNGIIDNEFHHVFIAELTTPLKNLRIQESEVAALQLFDLNILKNTNKYENILLPEFHEYYALVHSKITETLKEKIN